MYEEFLGHFGLCRNPFQVSPNPASFYSTSAHDEVLLQLVSRIEARQGFQVLTGEAGTGKTIVLRYLLEWLRKYRYSTAYIFHPLLRSTDLLELILADFAVPCRSRSKKELLLTLKNWLFDRHRVGDCPVIIIDEAQALSSRTLRKLGALLKLEVQGARVVQLVLAGQPKLERKLNRPKLAWLRSQLMYQCKLPALTASETAGYILSRLTSAGTAAGAFAEESVHEVFQHSRGVPRLINLLCEHALLAAYADRRTTVVPNDVLRAAQYFDVCEDAENGREKTPAGPFGSLVPFPRPLEAAAEAIRGANPEAPSLTVETAPDAHGRSVPAASAAAVVEVPEARAPVIEPEAPPVCRDCDTLVVTVRSVSVLIPEFATSRYGGEVASRMQDNEGSQPAVTLAFEPTPSRSVPESVVEVGPAVAGKVEAAPVAAVALRDSPSSAALARKAPASRTSPAMPRTRPVAVSRAHPPSARLRTAAKTNLLCERLLALPRLIRVALSKVPTGPPKPVHFRDRAVVVRLVRTKTLVVQYCRGVSKSLIHDGRAFSHACSLWLAKPVDRRGMSAIGRRALVAASAWLRTPLR
jgi:type II secretory pathway predicted ATPase ExeA